MTAVDIGNFVQAQRITTLPVVKEKILWPPWGVVHARVGQKLVKYYILRVFMMSANRVFQANLCANDAVCKSIVISAAF